MRITPFDRVPSVHTISSLKGQVKPLQFRRFLRFKSFGEGHPYSLVLIDRQMDLKTVVEEVGRQWDWTQSDSFEISGNVKMKVSALFDLADALR